MELFTTHQTPSLCGILCRLFKNEMSHDWLSTELSNCAPSKICYKQTLTPVEIGTDPDILTGAVLLRLNWAINPGNQLLWSEKKWQQIVIFRWSAVVKPTGHHWQDMHAIIGAKGVDYFALWNQGEHSSNCHERRFYAGFLPVFLWRYKPNWRRFIERAQSYSQSCLTDICGFHLSCFILGLHGRSVDLIEVFLGVGNPVHGWFQYSVNLSIGMMSLIAIDNTSSYSIHTWAGFLMSHKLTKSVMWLKCNVFQADHHRLSNISINISHGAITHHSLISD